MGKRGGIEARKASSKSRVEAEVEERKRRNEAVEVPMKILAELLSVRRAVRVGGSYYLPLPKEWVEFCCELIEGNYWFKTQFDDQQLIITNLDQKSWNELHSTIHRVDKKGG